MTINTSQTRELVAKEIDLGGFTDEEQKEIVDMLEENIVIKINNDIFHLLDEADRGEFILLSQEMKNEKIGAFLKEKIADLDGLIRRAAQAIIRDFKTRTQ